VREAVRVREQRFYLIHMLSTEEFAAFVICEARLKQTNINPAPKSVRVLEGPAWDPYLERRSTLFRAGKLLIHQWSASEVGAEAPFRGFLEMRRSSLVSMLPPLAVSFLGASLAILALVDVDWHDAPVTDVVTGAWKWAVGVLVVLGAGKLVSLAWQAPRGWAALKWLRRAFRRVEKLIYRSGRR
jgi:hypothetical protein